MIYIQLSLCFSLFFPADEKAKQKHTKFIFRTGQIKRVIDSASSGLKNPMKKRSRLKKA